MAGLNPRISVTLTPSCDAALKRLSDVSGQSRSSLVAELLEQSQGVFSRMADMIELAKTATDEARQRMAENMERAQAELQAQVGVAEDLFAAHMSDLVSDVEAVGRRKTKRPAAPLGGRAAPAWGGGGTLPSHEAGTPAAPHRPPHVTRGSGIPVTTPKKGGKPAAKQATKRVGRKNGQL